MADKDSTAHIYSLLAARYAGSEWVYVTEVPDGTGSKKNRSADAVAIGLWGKNAKEFHAFEVKSSRSDWTHELQDMEKSRSWRNTVASFWLVAGRGVAKLEEVPPDWGFLEVAANGESLKIRKQPAVMPRDSVKLNVVAAMVRRAADMLPEIYKPELAEGRDQYQAGYTEGRLREKEIYKGTEKRLEHLEGVIKRLGVMMGQSVEFMGPDNVALKIMKAAMHGNIGHLLNRMKRACTGATQLQSSLTGISDELGATLAEIENFSKSALNSESVLINGQN